MSKAGTGSGAKAKQREVQARIAEAAAQHDAEAAAAAQQAAFERDQRAWQLFVMCRQKIQGRMLCLWPPDALGWYIGEQMVNEAMHRLMVQARERQEAIVG